MHLKKFAALVLVYAIPAMAMDGPGAMAAYQDALKDTAKHKLYCEMADLQGKSIDAQMKGDSKKIPEYGRRISEIQAQLPGYAEALKFESSKSSDMAYYKSDEGKALNKASKELALSCPRPKK